MKWDLIIFDCDGVLVDSEAIGNRFIAEALTALGIETSTDEALGEFLGGKLTQIKISVEKKLDKKLPDVAIIDVKLDKGDNDGILLLDHIKKKNSDLPVIMISGHANIEMAVNSLKSGAFEFIQKPFDKDRLFRCLFNSYHSKQIRIR